MAKYTQPWSGSIMYSRVNRQQNPQNVEPSVILLLSVVQLLCLLCIRDYPATLVITVLIWFIQKPSHFGVDWVKIIKSGLTLGRSEHCLRFDLKNAIERHQRERSGHCIFLHSSVSTISESLPNIAIPHDTVPSYPIRRSRSVAKNCVKQAEELPRMDLGAPTATKRAFSF